MNKLLTNAKRLRCDQTAAEQRLWYFLRDRRFQGIKFKRQKPIGAFIVDFACIERRLVIELDGGQHALAVEADQRRDEWLRGRGFTVLRFWNSDVLRRTEAVLEVIARALAPSPLPLSQDGRGE